MFKFLKDQDEDKPGASKVQTELRPAAEVVVKDINYEISEKVESAAQKFGDFEPKFIQIKQLSGYLKENDKVAEILNSSSDLISGTYEGKQTHSWVTFLLGCQLLFKCSENACHYGNWKTN